MSSNVLPERCNATPTRSTSSATFASSLYTGITTETCRGALCGSTLQSSRRGREPAKADRAREEARLRIAAARMADHQPGRADGEEPAERPLHPWLRSEGDGFPRGGDG